jgi:hypothetical protein
MPGVVSRFRYALAALHGCARILPVLLGPCFKTGGIQSSIFIFPNNQPQLHVQGRQRNGNLEKMKTIHLGCRFFSTVSRTSHSLFRVLFIFPSRYLFAIGLPVIFSFRWSEPPHTLGCTLKQPDSNFAQSRHQNGVQRGYHPLWHCVPADFYTNSDANDKQRDISSKGFYTRALPRSLAVTKGIPVGFFSSA